MRFPRPPWWESLWIKKAPVVRGLHTQDKRALFIQKQLGFPLGFLGTLSTLYEKYVVFIYNR